MHIYSCKTSRIELNCKRFLNFLVLAVFISPLSLIKDVHAEEKVVLVLDVSGSMWGQIDGKTKIEIARDSIKSLVKDWPESREVGLVAYGHQKKGDCNDIETVLPIGSLNKSKLSKVVDGLTPKGMTPLSASVKHAAEELKYTENKATVILISDGIENCNLDPCSIGSELESNGIDFTAHVIGFDIGKVEDQKGLKCLAENTGGMYFSANNAEQLSEALDKTTKELIVEKPPTPSPSPTPEPTSTPLPEAKIQAPETAIAGTEIEVLPEADKGLEGYLYLYPKGRDKSLTHSRVNESKDGNDNYDKSTIRLPAITGEYVIKWESSDRKILAESPITLTEAEVSLEVQEEIIKGSEAEVKINAPAGLDGYLYLYKAGVGSNKSITYSNVRESSDGIAYDNTKLRMPTTTGDYEIRWENSRKEILASTTVKVIDAEISIDAPDEANAGTEIDVKIQAPEGLDGYIYLYAQGRDKHITYSLVRVNAFGDYETTKIRLPGRSGNFELKWENSRKELLAEKKIKVIDVEITLKHADKAPVNTEVEVTLDAPDGLSGYIYLYAAGRDKHLTYESVRMDNIQGYKPLKLKLPNTPGSYEIKWQTNNKETLAVSVLEVVDAKMAISCPSEILPGDRFDITIDAPPGVQGHIYVYKKGDKKGSQRTAVREGRIDDYDPVTLKAPEEIGEYDVKWFTSKNELLAETSFNVVENIKPPSATAKSE